MGRARWNWSAGAFGTARRTLDSRVDVETGSPRSLFMRWRGWGFFRAAGMASALTGPFDRKRDGFIPEEGGAALFLEAAEIAERRGQRSGRKVKGFGNCTRVLHDQSLTVLSPGECEEHGPGPGKKRVVTSGTLPSSPPRERFPEGRPIGAQFRQGGMGRPRSQEIPICGMKAYTGHLVRASILPVVIFSIQSIKDRMVPGRSLQRLRPGIYRTSGSQGYHRDLQPQITFYPVSYGSEDSARP